MLRGNGLQMSIAFYGWKVRVMYRVADIDEGKTINMN